LDGDALRSSCLGHYKWYRVNTSWKYGIKCHSTQGYSGIYVHSLVMCYSSEDVVI